MYIPFLFAWNVGGGRSARVLFQARLLSAWNQTNKKKLAPRHIRLDYPPNELMRFL